MLKPQFLEAIFVMAASLIGFAAGSPAQSHVRRAFECGMHSLVGRAVDQSGSAFASHDFISLPRDGGAFSILRSSSGRGR
jgi:hypothetical protein